MSADLVILLSGLYETASKARAVAQGLVPIELVEAEGSSAVVWSSILREASKQGRLAELLDRVVLQYPSERARLLSARDRYEIPKVFGQGPPNGRTFLVPPLSSHYVPRNAFIEDISARLISSNHIGVLPVLALHGFGGVGKSTIAKAICYLPSIEQHFEGVMWAELGTEANPTDAIVRWIKALGDDDFRPSSMADASDRLRFRLYGRKMLLILDDVWHARDAQPFLVAPGCAVLLTTRRVSVAEDLGAHVHEVPSMSEGEAIQLIERWLRRTLPAHELRGASELAASVNHLPLALELAGSLLSRGMTWEDARAAFEAEADHLQERDARLSRQLAKVLGCIRISVRELRKEDYQRWERFATLGILAPSVDLHRELAATVWRTGPASAALVLQELRDDALLQQVGDVWRLHALVRDVAVQTLIEPPPDGAGQTLKSAHASFLNACGWSRSTGVHSRLRDDGYTTTHLTWHLEKAGEITAIHELLSARSEDGRCVWWESLSSRNQAATFLADIDRGSRLAIADPNPFALLYRYTLVRSSLATVAQCFAPEVVRSLIERGLWDFHQAIAVASQVKSPDRAAELMTVLVETSSLVPAGPLSKTLVDAAVQAILRLEKGWRRARFAARASRATAGATRESLCQIAILTTLELLGARQELNWRHKVPSTLVLLPPVLYGSAVTEILERLTLAEGCLLALVLASYVRRIPFEDRTTWVRAVREWCEASLAKPDESRITPPVQHASMKQHEHFPKPPTIAGSSTLSPQLLLSTASDYRKHNVAGTGTPVPGTMEGRASANSTPQTNADSAPETSIDSTPEIFTHQDVISVLIRLFKEDALDRAYFSRFVTTPTLLSELGSGGENHNLESIITEISKLNDAHEQIAQLAPLRERISGSLKDRASRLAIAALKSLWADNGFADPIDALESLGELVSGDARLSILADLKPYAWSAEWDAGWRLARLASVLPNDSDQMVKDAEKRFLASGPGRSKDLSLAALTRVLNPERIRTLLITYPHIGDYEQRERLRFTAAIYSGQNTSLNEIALQSHSERMKSLARMMQHLIEFLNENQLKKFVEAASELVADWWVVEELTDLLVHVDDESAILRLLGAAREIGPPDLRSRLASRAVQRLADLGQLDAAIAASYRVEVLSQRWCGLTDTVENLAAKGRFREAILIAEAILDEEERGRAQAFISLHWARLGDLGQALLNARQINSHKWRAWADGRLATAIHSSGVQVVSANKNKETETTMHPTAEEPEPWRRSLDKLSKDKLSKQNAAWAALVREITSDAALPNLARFWGKPCAPTAQNFFQFFESELRPTLLERFRYLVPVVARYGNRDDLSAMDHVTKEIGGSWP